MHGGIYRCTGIYFFKSAENYGISSAKLWKFREISSLRSGSLYFNKTTEVSYLFCKVIGREWNLPVSGGT